MKINKKEKTSNQYSDSVKKNILVKLKYLYDSLLRHIKEDKKKAAIEIAIIAIIIILLVAGIATVIKNNSNKGGEQLSYNNMQTEEGSSIEIVTETETENESETEETEAEEESETEDEIVEEEAVAEFFENEIATEDQEALALPSRILSDEFIPYDGVSRQISYFGDSMVFGVGNASVSAVVNGMNITGWTAPGTIEYFTHIHTYNFGEPGETSDEIAYRAGGINVYLDRDITISEDTAATARLIDDNGNTFTFGDYSGYAHEDNQYSNTVYISGYLCSVNNVGDGQVSIKLVRGYAAYNMSYVDPVNIQVSQNSDTVAELSDDEPVLLASANLDIALNTEVSGIVTYDINQAQPASETNQGATNNNQGITGVNQNTTNTGSNTETAKPTEASTQPSTAKPTEAPTQTQPETIKPTESATIGLVTMSAGSKAVSKAAYDRSRNDILILEIGSNGGWGSDYQTLILQYDSIILNSGCKYYIIVGDTDDPGTSIGDYNQKEYNEDGSYIGIGDTSWEAALREAYGAHFFNTRTYLIQNGLNDCGLDTTSDDLENFKLGNISKQLRSDWTHFNAYGYYAKGKGIYQKGVELGYWE